MDKKLRTALQEKEKYELFLANLDRLHADKTINDSSFKSLKNEYSLNLRRVVFQIEQIKSEVNKKLEISTRELAVYKQELANMEARHRVGQISAGDYFKDTKKPEKKITALENVVAYLTSLLAAAHSSEIVVKMETGLASLINLKGRGTGQIAYSHISPDRPPYLPADKSQIKPPPEVQVPDTIVISSLTILPERVQPGATVGVIASAVNTGIDTVTHRAEFKVNNRLEAVSDITLEPGKSGELTFMTLAYGPGDYLVSVDAASGRFKVMPIA